MSTAAWEEAKARLAPGHAVVLWKPGCTYCTGLKAEFEDDDRFTWVNIAEDGAAAEVVRKLNDGDELTPTVLIGDQGFANPGADQIRSELG